MYINDRDQINYHGFLKALRAMNKVGQECVSTGICTVSGMNRFENGNRIAEKLMRDRLTARMGISGEKYEDYLQPREYARWQHRLRLIKAIEKRDLIVAKEELSAYEVLPKLNTPNKQFVEAMRYMILSLENASLDERLACVKKAIKYTVPNVKKALNGAHLLADQEINLIAEQMRLLAPKAAVRDERAWRISEYEKLIAYMDNSHWEVLQKAKVYPKVVYYICQLIAQKEATEEELRHGLELCHTAIELLRDSRRLYYFIELTEMRKILAERFLLCDLSSSERTKIQEMLTENETWKKVFKELYAEYDIAPYMSNFCYLYYETECHNMAEVIEIRRKMFNLSRMKLSEGICTDRTIIRTERQSGCPNIEVIRMLFEKLGLCAEYRRAQIITTDVKALVLYNEDLYKEANDNNCEIALRYIDKIKGSIDMNLSHNKQELMRLENCLLHKAKQISEEIFALNIIQSLECTIDSLVLLRNRDKFFTRSEITCIHDLAFEVNTLVSEACLEIVEDICNENRMDKIESRLSIREFLIGRWSEKLSDEKRYGESSEISNAVLKECLTHYRMLHLWDNLYNNIWNYQQENELYVKSIVNKGLKMCVVLSQVIKDYNAAAFFQKKIDETNY